jgi:hypothetical protein
MHEEAIGPPARRPSVRRRPLTVAEYHSMGEAGILNEDDRVELIEGQLFAMPAISALHAGTVNGLNFLLVRAVGERGVVVEPVLLPGAAIPVADILGPSPPP